MQITSLRLHNFRNYEEREFFFEPGINLIVGENGKGKTNLLEALYFFIIGRSFRTPHLFDLVHFGKTEFYLELHFIKNGIEQVLKVYSDGKQKKILHNFTPIHNVSSLFGILFGVVLSPHDSALIQGEPSLRRQFIDVHIAQANPLYLYHLSRYLRAMKQRNSHLRKKELKNIQIWEEEMAYSAEFVTLEREKTIKQLGEEAKPLQTRLSNSQDTFSLRYKSQALGSMKKPSEFFKEQYEKHRLKEMELGYTLSGPHKDDLSILLDDKEARSFASEGQIRSSVLSMKFAEWQRFKKIIEEMPLIFLDDVCMGLDHEREKSLFSYIPQLGQVFITSPRSLPPSFLQGHEIPV